MKLLVSVVLATSVGVCVGATGVEVLRAQAKPPVYAIAEVDVRDPDAYAKEYIPLARSRIKAHGGQTLAAGSAVAIDGEPPKPRVAIVKWDSIEQLKDWRNSPEYMKARAIGEKFATYRVIAIEGLPQ
jgi:uncharacterized protein (DUF1330 family)